MTGGRTDGFAPSSPAGHLRLTSVVGVLVLSDLGELDRHETGEWHPERPARLEAVRRGIADALGPDGDGIVRGRTPARQPPTRSSACTRRATSGPWSGSRRRAAASSIRTPRCRPARGTPRCTPPVPVSRWSTQLRARGAGVGFVAVRPPGHHARPGVGMGFCLLNNVAIAAAALAEAGERVLVVDWDVHHGNGTQDAFWDDPRVLYVSMHQAPMYPGTGRVSETGGPGRTRAPPSTSRSRPAPPGSCTAARSTRWSPTPRPRSAPRGS